MKHPKEIQYEGGMEQLATDLGNLRYDALAEFLRLLGDKIYLDSTKDLERDRRKLAIELYHAGAHIKEAWHISKPFMPDGNN